jgi:predicted enzyme related to lactoylglutathione lyase
MLNLNSLLLFSDDTGKLVEFYKKVLDQKPGWEEGDFTGFKVGDGHLMIGPHDKVKGKNKNPERIMFNLEADDVEEEFGRIKKLGAKVIAEPYHPGEAEDMQLATFADPDGNFFQIASKMEA